MYIIIFTRDRFISACFNETIPNAVFTDANFLKRRIENHELKTILKQDVQNDVTSLNTKKCTPTFQSVGYKRMMQPTQLIFKGQWTHKSQGTVLQLTTDH